MLVTVFIKRRIKPGYAAEVFTLLNKFRSEAMDQRGYVSGKTLIDQDDPQKVLVISEWLGLENWLAWKEHPNRVANESNIQPYLDSATEYEVYSLSANAPLRKKGFVEGGAAARTMPM